MNRMGLRIAVVSVVGLALVQCGDDDSPRTPSACDAGAQDCQGGVDAGLDAGPGAPTDAQVGDTGQADSGTDAAVDAALGDVDSSSSGDAGVVDGQVIATTDDVCAHSVSAALLQTGHSTDIRVTRVAGDRVLSHDKAGHWILWNATTRSAIASGNTGTDQSDEVYAFASSTTADLVGSKLIVSKPDLSVEVRSSVDGSLLVAIPDASPAMLSSDASYVHSRVKYNGVNPVTVSAWSLSGQLLFTHTGTYPYPTSEASQGTIFAAPGELRAVRNTPDGQVIERTSIPAGVVTTSAVLTDTFFDWFGDGENYLTRTGAIMRVFSKDGVLRQLIQLESTNGLAGGFGQFVWAHNNSGPVNDTTSKVWRVGEAQPVLSDLPDPPRYFNQGMLVIPELVMQGVSTLDLNNYTVVDLRGQTPGMAKLVPPLDYGDSASKVLLATDGLGGWTIAKASLLFATTTGAAKATSALGCGAALDIVGAENGCVAVANADGKIRVYDLSQSDRPLTQVITGVVAPFGLDLSRDGATLGVQSSLPAGSYRVLSTTDGTLLHDYAPLPVAGELARATPTVGVLGCTGAGFTQCTVALSDTSGKAIGNPFSIPTMAGDPYGTSYNVKLAISSDGRRVAVESAGDGAALATSVIYVDGALQGATQGGPLAWLDDTHLLVSRVIHNPMGSGIAFRGGAIVDSTGTTTQALTTLPLMVRVREIDASRFYSRQLNTIYSATDGSALWTGASKPTLTNGGTAADLAGSYAVVATGQGVTIEAWR